MPVAMMLGCVAALLASAALAIAIGGRRDGCLIVYGASLAVSGIAFVVALIHLVTDTTAALTLPFGLPWLGAHLRLDALAAFSLVVVNLGGAMASLYALGHGRHEPAPLRVLPFFRHSSPR